MFLLIYRNCYYTVTTTHEKQPIFLEVFINKNRKKTVLIDNVFHLETVFIIYSKILNKYPYPSFSRSSFLINFKAALFIQYLKPPNSNGPSSNT